MKLSDLPVFATHMQLGLHYRHILPFPAFYVGFGDLT